MPALRATRLVLVLLALSSTLQSQGNPLATQLERVAGLTAESSSAFFAALRRNVGRGDRKATCAVVAYPLAQATGVVKDASECEARYDSIFTLAVRKAVGTQRFEELFVSPSGVMFGNGELWFAGTCGTQTCQQASDLRIIAINSQTAGLQPPKGKVLVACFVAGQRIRVSADGLGSASLSVWRTMRPDGAPDLELPHPEPPGPPTQCGSRSWTFTDGTRTYVVADLPCDAYLSPPPMGSVGRVTLSTPASTDAVPLWCRE